MEFYFDLVFPETNLREFLKHFVGPFSKSGKIIAFKFLVK